MNSKLITKVLLIALSLVFVITVFASCGVKKDDFEELKTNVSDVEKKADDNSKNIEENNKKLETLETKKVVAELRALAEQIKLTADAAATQTALAEAKAALEAADTNNKAATDKAIADAKAALEASVATDKAAAAKALADVKAALEAADTANSEAASKALADAKAELEAVLASNASADAATKAALEKAIKELGDTVSGNKTNIENALASVKSELEGADAAVADAAAKALADAKAELNETISNNKTALDKALADAVASFEEAYKAADKAIIDSLNDLKDKHNTLSGKVSAIEALIGDMGDTTVAAEIADIKSQLACLGSDIAVTMNEFIRGYDLASKILAGEATVEDFANEEEYNRYKDLTLENFDASIKVITDRKAWYLNIGGVAATEYEEFDAKTKNIRFFIGRATSKETVETYFTRLQKAIDDLMTLDELFVVAIDDIIDNKKVTDKTESYDMVTKIKNEIDAVNSTGESLIEISQEYLDKYDLIVAAQENLAAAMAAVEGDVENYIKLIDDTVVYGVSEAEIEAARQKFVDFDTYYFKRDEVVEIVELYDVAKYTAILLVDNYDTLAKAEARVVELNNANAAKPTIIDVVSNFDTARPLWTDYDAIKAFDDEVTAWKQGNTGENGWAALEPENVEVILGAGNDELIDRALEYANAMKNIYAQYNENDSLKSLIEDLNDDTLQLYSRYDEFKSAESDLNSLENAIKGCVDYVDSLDSNFVTMIGESNIVMFRGDAVTGQMVRLHTAYNTINGYKIAIENLINNEGGKDDVDIYEYDVVASIKTNIAVASAIPGITVDDENYDMIVKPAMDAYNRWIAAYKDKTAKIAEIYNAVKKGMTTGYTLAEGNEVVRINNLVLDLVKYYGVGNLNVKVYVDVEPVVLETVINQWNAFAGEFRTKAELAEAKAKDVNDLITEAFKNLSTDNLNNYEEITNAYKMFTDWADKHLGGDYTRAAIEAIQNICKINAPSETYTFVRVDTFEILDDMNSKAEARKELSNEEWADVSEKFGALADKWTVGSAKTETQWDIHSKSAFEEAEAAYQAFITKFYNGTVNGAGYNGEVAAYALFTAEYDEFNALIAIVNSDFDAINDAINALMAEGLNNIDDSDVVAIDAARTLIANFKSNYDCDVLTCAGGYAITVDQRNFLARAQAKAAYTAKYIEAVTEAGTDDEKLAALATALDNANLLIGEATITGTTNTIESVYDFAVSNFEAALA